MKRRAAFFVFMLCFPVAAFGAERPNFVLILIDDMAWNGTPVPMDDDLPNSSMPILDMPNLEKLAAVGMKFRNAYAAAPQCSPSRVAIQTGQTGARNGFTVYLGGKNTYPDKDPHFPYFFESRDLELMPHKTNTSDLNLDREEITIAEALHPLGYASAHFGKWHMRGNGPGDHGYEAHDGDTDNRAGNQRIPRDPKLMFSVTRRSVDFIEDQAKLRKPFYLHISHYAVHEGRESLDHTRDKYADDPRIRHYYEEAGETAETTNPRQDPARWLAMAEDLDTTIGTVLDKLDELGIADHTYVFVVSDNGYRHWTADQPQPLRGTKWWLWDGGLRVPMFVRGPGIEPGSVCHTNVVHYDYLPTFVQLAGGDIGKLQHVDGVSLNPLLEGREAPQMETRNLYFHYPHYRTSLPVSAMISGKWKVMHFYEESDLPILFNLESDLGETDNVAGEHPEVHKKLYAQMTAYLKQVGARIPAPNPNHDPDKLEVWYGADKKRWKDKVGKDEWRPFP
jgi:arylsulfatase A-like enzyme